MVRQVSSANLETRTNIVNTVLHKVVLPVTLAGVIGSLGYIGYFWVQHEREVKKNLAPNALHFRRTMVGTSDDFRVGGVNDDVNGDGTYESVLRFVNPLTGNVESRLIEKDGNNIRLRKYEVVDGQIKYLPE